MLWSLSLTLSTILVICEFSRANCAALKTEDLTTTAATLSADEKSAIEYYSELLTQLVHTFPEVDKEEPLTNYQKRMYGRYGRTVKRVSDLYPSIAAELRAELDRRKLIEMTKREKIIYDSPESSVTSLQQMEKRLENLEKKFLHEGSETEPEEADVTEQEKTPSADNELERKLLRMLEGEKLAPETPPTDVSPQPHAEYPAMQGLKSQIESAQDELAEIIGKLSQIEDNSRNKDMLDHLSKQLAANQKSDDKSELKRQSTTSTPTTTTITPSMTVTSSNTDKLTQLASIVKNLIQVNQLAYLQLQDQIRESR